MAGSVLHRLRMAVRPLVPRRLHAPATRAVGYLVALALAGNRVACSCCGAHLRRFVAYPSLYCPRCGAYERHRLLALQLRDRPDLLRTPLRVLQVSPDRPLERLLRRDGLSVVSIDIDNPNADLQMDVHAMSFSGESFDAVLALAVLDAVIDQPRALDEIHRVLAVGGVAILQVSFDRQPELAANLAAAGFDTEILRATDLGPEMIERHGLIPDEETFVCRKTA